MNSKLSVEAALERFLLQLQANGRSHHTIGQYRRHVRLLGHWLADVGRGSRVCDIDHETLAAFLASGVARTRPDGRRALDTGSADLAERNNQVTMQANPPRHS